MARYESLFNAFGPSRLGQIAGATVVGGLIGGVAARKSGSTDWLVFGLTGAVIGFLAGIGLVLAEIRRDRVMAGRAKPLGKLFWIIVLPIVAVVGFVLLVIAAVAMPKLW